MQGIDTLEPYLETILAPVLRKKAEDAFEAGDAEGFLCMLDNTLGLRCVFDNMHVFKAKGMYEKALVRAYVSTRTNWASWQISQLEFAFRMGDQTKLREAGDPFPPRQSFTLYRGVSGKPPFRKVSGMSWTSDLDKAIWFATRSPCFRDDYLREPDPTADNCKQLEIVCADPAVYKTLVRPDEVYCYVNDRNEHDFILRTRRYQRLDIPVERKAKS